MAYKIKVAGIEIVCETADEAIAFATKMVAHKHAPPAAAKPRHHTNGAAPKPAVEYIEQPEFPAMHQGGGRQAFNIDKATVSFLDTIRRGGKAGADGDALTRALRLNHPKGLGGRIAMFNKRIKELGFEPDEVYSVKRDSSTEGKRVWFATPSLDEAINLLV